MSGAYNDADDGNIGGGAGSTFNEKNSHQFINSMQNDARDKRSADIQDADSHRSGAALSKASINKTSKFILDIDLK